MLIRSVVRGLVIAGIVVGVLAAVRGLDQVEISLLALSGIGFIILALVSIFDRSRSRR